ncbi:MAG: ABC transporter substrate-binding protein [Deinococcota bacterium]
MERIILQPHVRFGDPHVNSDDKNRLSILANVVEPLVSRDATGNIHPQLAKTWQVSEDGRKWQLELQQGVHFHDGSPLTAGDVVANLERIRDHDLGGELGTAGVYQSYLAGATLTSTGELGVRIDMPEPASELLDILERFPIMPADRLGDAALETEIIGTGGYKLAELADDSVVLEPFADYWRDSKGVDTLEFRAQANPEARVNALLAHQAHIISEVPLAHLPDVVHSARLVSLQSTVCVIIMFNMASDAVRDVRVRQAINYAVDTKQLIKALHQGYALPLHGPLTPLHSGFDGGSSGYDYNPDKARRLLDDAGISELSLVLDAPTIHPHESPRLTRTIAQQCAEIGINVTVNLHDDRPAYAEMVRASQVQDACVFDSSPISSYRVLREKFHSGVKGPWWLGYQNSAVDDAIDAIANTTHASDKQALYSQVQQHIVRDAPWLFLYSPMRHWGMRSDIFWQPAVDGLMLF